MNNRGSGGGWFGLIVLAILLYIGMFLLCIGGIALIWRVVSAYREHRLSTQDQRLFQRSFLCACGVVVLLGILNLIVYAFNPSVGGGLVYLGFLIGIGEFLAVCKLIEFRGRYIRQRAPLPLLQQSNPWWP